MVLNLGAENESIFNSSRERRLGITEIENVNNPNICITTNDGGAQTITNNNFTLVEFDTGFINPIKMFKASANTKITIPEDGIYEIVGQTQYASNITGHRTIRITLNGVIISIGTKTDDAVIGGKTTTTRAHVFRDLKAGDFLHINTQQSSGGDLNLVGGIRNTFLSVTKIRETEL